jgi:DNA mismatch repair protein MutS
MAEPTPLMKQYQSVKDQYPDEIVLFRLGDFYEMFGRDAQVASRVLQIALTTRDKGKDNPLPMCGIPHFAADSYIAKLIQAGHKVAICEQVEDPKDAKGIVRREVVRVVTPGTHAPANPKSNSYLLAVMPHGQVQGIAVADVSTGEFILYETPRNVEDELARFEPAEVLVPANVRDDFHYAEALQGQYVTFRETWPYDYEEAYRIVLRRFGVSTLDGYGCEGMGGAVMAAGMLLQYLDETEGGEVRFRRIRTHRELDFMGLDMPTQRNLELIRNLRDGGLEGTLLRVLDETQTPMGGRFLKNSVLRPLLDIESIRARHGAVRYLVDDFELIERIRRPLRHVSDVERLAQRVVTGHANARELVALKNSLAYVPELRGTLRKTSEMLLREIEGNLVELPDSVALIEHAIEDHPPLGMRDGGIIKAGFHAEIDELRSLSTDARGYIARLQATEREETGISSLKVGYNRVFGYYIEVTRANLEQVPPHYMRKQTIAGGERFVTEELKEYEARVLGAEERIKPLELEVFEEVRAQVAGLVDELVRNAEALAFLDFLVSLAVVAKRHHYVMPRMREEVVLRIGEGRHPVIERMDLGERFIPNDTDMDGERGRVLVITGPNMAGKSTYMRQVALIVLMAHMGGFVPAESAEIGIVDRIFTRIGAADFIAKGQSTFMVEMVETANILNNATARSLILLDEVGRGTSTFDGISIAWATAEYIAEQIRAMTLFATHYIELTDLTRSIGGVRNANILVKEWGESIVFLRKIAEGPADKSYGIHVARLAGLPDRVVDRAREVLRGLEEQHVEARPAGKGAQLGLFAPLDTQIANEVARARVDSMSPAEALDLLRTLKGMADGIS